MLLPLISITFFVLNFLTPGNEIWLCDNIEIATPLYTDTPTRSREEACKKGEVENSAFNRVSAEHFYIRPERVIEEFTKTEKSKKKASKAKKPSSKGPWR